MSRKNSIRSNRKLLLDTSFLLPVLGFETLDEIMKIFHKLKSYEIHYNEISILEALWKIVKEIKGEEEEISRIMDGIKAIRETIKHTPIDDKAVSNAILMYQLGHRDMIDNLLYSIALSRKLTLLTVDKKLIEFVKEHNLPKNNIITPKELD